MFGGGGGGGGGGYVYIHVCVYICIHVCKARVPRFRFDRLGKAIALD